MPGSATYIVYKTPSGASQVRRTSDDSDLLAPGASPDDAIRTALNRVDPNDKFSGGPGDIYVQSGRYDLADDFAGFVVNSYTNLRLDPKAQIRVPPDYAGPVFQLLSDDGDNIAGVTTSSITGGRLTERTAAGSQPGARWTAFLLKGSATSTLTGVQFCKIAETEVTSAGVGIHIEVDELLGYVNSNTVEFVRMQDCRTFVSFRMADLAYTTGIPIWSNRFTDLQLECGTKIRTTVGIRNVVGRQQEFDSVKVWDIQRGESPSPDATPPPPPLTIQISAQAERTLIIGGILYGGFVGPQNVDDKGVETKILI